MTERTTTRERAPAGTSESDPVEAHRELLFPCVSPYYEDPLVLVEGEGTVAVDRDGNEYLDFFSGILTTSVGHCHPEVVDRVRGQMERLGHTSTLYVTENQVRVARTLSDLAPGRLKKSFFTNSGTEAVETAVMLARLHTGRSDVIALRHAYSGRSHLTTEIGAHAPWRPLDSTVAGVKHARSPYPYRSPFEGDGEELAEKFAEELEEVILTTTTGEPAAFIAEPIQGVGGFVVPPPGYFQRAAEVIRSYGGLFICDEVQTGFGRTGEEWFGIEHWDVEPDIMVMAKGIANGFPVGATIARPEVADSWTNKSISTFGGNPVSMAAAQATMDVMEREDTPARSAARGAQLREGLDALGEEYSWIGDVRGKGLMQALELVEGAGSRDPAPEKAQALLERAKDERLLLGLGGLHGNVLRLGPSMLVDDREVEEALDRLSRACRRVRA